MRQMAARELPNEVSFRAFKTPYLRALRHLRGFQGLFLDAGSAKGSVAFACSSSHTLAQCFSTAGPRGPVPCPAGPREILLEFAILVF